MNEIRKRSTDSRVKVAQKISEKGDPSHALSKHGSLVLQRRLMLDDQRGRKLGQKYERLYILDENYTSRAVSMAKMKWEHEEHWI